MSAGSWIWPGWLNTTRGMYGNHCDRPEQKTCFTKKQNEREINAFAAQVPEKHLETNDSVKMTELTEAFWVAVHEKRHQSRTRNLVGFARYSPGNLWNATVKGPNKTYFHLKINTDQRPDQTDRQGPIQGLRV